MVSAVQLYARDVPGLGFLVGTDLLQMLWRPLVHENGQYAANPRLHWRTAALTAAGATVRKPPRPHTSDEDYLPRPCTVSPTPAVEYPNWDLPEGLSELLSQRFEDLKEGEGATTASKVPPRSRARSGATRGGLSRPTGPTAQAAPPVWTPCSVSPRVNQEWAGGFP